MEKIIITATLLFMAGFFKSVMDVLQFKFHTSVFRNLGTWWNPKESWKFKYKNNDPEQGEKFPGFKTVLVWITDAWHFFQFWMKTCLELAIAINIVEFPIWISFLVAKCLFSGSFSIFWKLFQKK